MEFSWTILGIVFIVNAGYMAFMYFLQAVDVSLPPRGSLIPGTRQKFLYVQDFHSCSWGDFLGLPLIYNSFVMLVIVNEISWWQWAIFFIVAIVDGYGFYRMCMTKDHKPDQGYPEIGKASWHGLSHLPYHGVGVAISLLVIGNWIAGNLWGPVLYVVLAGGAIYIASVVTDFKVGNFDPLKLEDDLIAERNPISMTPCESCSHRDNCPGPC